MSDPFHIAARALRSGRRICADCGSRFQLSSDAAGEVECCDACRSRRARLIERLADKFHLIPKEVVPSPRAETNNLQRCADCGKEFQPNARGIPLDHCCEECHGKRMNLVDNIADQTFKGWHTKQKPKERVVAKRLWRYALVAALLGCAIWFGAPPARKAYHHWREKKHFARATDYFAKGDYRHAMIDARNTLVFNWDNTEAIRLMAKTCDALHLPQAVEWRARFAQLVPNDLENSLGWAGAAIRAGDYPTADRILKQIPSADHNTATFHHLSALLAINRRDSIKAEYHWAEAAKLNPADDGYKLNMAALRLKLGSNSERTNALDLLAQLSVSSKERLPAMRALLSDAIHHGEHAHARQLAIAVAEDQKDQKALFSDKLLRLSTLNILQDPDFPIWRARLEAESTERPESTYELLIWMNRNSFAKDVPALLPKLKQEDIMAPPVSVAVADSYAVLKDWTALQKLLKAAKWGRLDYVRLSTLAWALENSGDHSGAASMWKTALGAAESRLERMETLARSAISWGWSERADEALWKITTFSVQSPTWVLQALWTRTLQRGDTDKLRHLARLMLQANPKGLTARNNYIFLSLLKRTEEGAPHAAAEALYKENPTNPTTVSTYALSLFLLGRARAAEEVMETLQPAQLRDPSIAIYYAIFLAGAKHTARAEEYFKLAEKNYRLLPEEQAIKERVLQKAPPVQPRITPSRPANATPQPPGKG